MRVRSMRKGLWMVMIYLYVFLEKFTGGIY